jgi:integrase
MERHLAEAKLGRKTRDSYRGYHRKHITPLLGKLKINGVLDPDLLDVFYAELARCREHCTGRPAVKHWTDRPHPCSDRCRRHVCRPLADWTIRKIHWMLHGAYKRAIRRK